MFCQGRFLHNFKGRCFVKVGFCIVLKVGVLSRWVFAGIFIRIIFFVISLLVLSHFHVKPFLDVVELGCVKVAVGVLTIFLFVFLLLRIELEITCKL